MKQGPPAAKKEKKKMRRRDCSPRSRTSGQRWGREGETGRGHLLPASVSWEGKGSCSPVGVKARGGEGGSSWGGNWWALGGEGGRATGHRGAMGW